MELPQRKGQLLPAPWQRSNCCLRRIFIERPTRGSLLVYKQIQLSFCVSQLTRKRRVPTGELTRSCQLLDDIRLEIWCPVLPSPCVVKLYIPDILHATQHLFHHRLRFITRTFTPSPAILFINRESRPKVLETSVPILHSKVLRLYLGPTLDTIFIHLPRFRESDYESCYPHRARDICLPKRALRELRTEVLFFGMDFEAAKCFLECGKL